MDWMEMFTIEAIPLVYNNEELGSDFLSKTEIRVTDVTTVLQQ